MAKLPADQIRQVLTRDYSTRHFRIEYGSYLTNHLLRAVMALHELGATECKIADFAANYTKKLEAGGLDHEDVAEHPATADIIPDEEARVLLGKRRDFDGTASRTTAMAQSRDLLKC